MRTIRSDFISVTRPWIEKIEVTKDLKPLRKAMFFLFIKKLANWDHDISDEDFGTILKKHIPSLRDEIFSSPIGGKKVREDIWRRLLWMEMTIDALSDRR